MRNAVFPSAMLVCTGAAAGTRYHVHEHRAKCSSGEIATTAPIHRWGNDGKNAILAIACRAAVAMQSAPVVHETMNGNFVSAVKHDERVERGEVKSFHKSKVGVASGLPLYATKEDAKLVAVYRLTFGLRLPVKLGDEPHGAPVNAVFRFTDYREGER